MAEEQSAGRWKCVENQWLCETFSVVVRGQRSGAADWYEYVGRGPPVSGQYYVLVLWLGSEQDEDDDDFLFKMSLHHRWQPPISSGIPILMPITLEGQEQDETWVLPQAFLAFKDTTLHFSGLKGCRVCLGLNTPCTKYNCTCTTFIISVALKKCVQGKSELEQLRRLS